LQASHNALAEREWETSCPISGTTPDFRRERMQMKKHSDDNENRTNGRDYANEAIERVVQLVSEAVATERARRAAKYGRWAPVVEHGEQLVGAMLSVAEDAVRGLPRQRAKVQRFRDFVNARLAGNTSQRLSLDDASFTIRLLAQLADDELGIKGLGSITATAFAFAGMPTAPSRARSVTPLMTFVSSFASQFAAH
jgi:hypothetical protein